MEGRPLIQSGCKCKLIKWICKTAQKYVSPALSIFFFLPSILFLKTYPEKSISNKSKYH